MKQTVPNQDSIEEMLYQIYRIMDNVFNPVCSKCHSKITTCDCELKKSKLIIKKTVKTESHATNGLMIALIQRRENEL